MTDLKDLEERIAENEAHGLYTSPAVRELIEELKRLRAQRILSNEDFSRAFDMGLAAGERRERAAVVAFLRGDPDWCECTTCLDAALYEHASAIERGEHRREEEP